MIRNIRILSKLSKSNCYNSKFNMYFKVLKFKAEIVEIVLKFVLCLYLTTLIMCENFNLFEKLQEELMPKGKRMKLRKLEHCIIQIIVVQKQKLFKNIDENICVFKAFIKVLSLKY